MIFAPGIFRLVLALAVVVSHMSAIGIGRPAVFAFFTLSGYWVTKMYAEKYADVLTFYKSRFLRIFLPFVVAYVLGFILMDGEMKDLPGLAIFGIASTHNDVLGVSWSLDIELQFYALVPVLLFVGLRNAVLASIGLFVAAWYLKITYDIWTVFLYAPSFLLGAWICLSKWKPGFGPAAGSVVAFAAIGALAFTFDWSRPFIMKTGGEPFDVDWFGMAWTAVLAPWFAFNVRQPGGWLDRHLGNASYALYITHWPVIALMIGHGKPLTFAVIVAVCAVFYIVVDIPAEKVRAMLLRKPKIA